MAHIGSSRHRCKLNCMKAIGILFRYFFSIQLTVECSIAKISEPPPPSNSVDYGLVSMVLVVFYEQSNTSILQRHQSMGRNKSLLRCTIITGQLTPVIKRKGMTLT